jgi:hypothetical protein
MADGFQVARLIPVSGISNNVEAEMRATSALLSVVSVVRDFSRALLSPLGASTARKASVEAFIETSFKLANGTLVRPDGLVRVTYGSSVWQALVEVKTGSDQLGADQLTNYLALAKEQGFDAVLTISNEIAVGDRHPCEALKLRANSRVKVAHRSWTEILAHAVQIKVHRGVEDPEQAWILGELIRYLEHPASGALAFDDMGQDWVAVRDGAREATLHRGSNEAREIALRWEQLVRFTALRLGAETGADVQPVVPRAQSDPKARLGHLIESLCGDGVLDATIRVPRAAGDLVLTSDLRARQLTMSATVTAPSDRGNKAKVTWLVRQLGDDTPGEVLIEAWPRNARQALVATLDQVREQRELLLDPDKRDIIRFRLVLRAEMGRNRRDGGRTQGFGESVTGLVERFYGTVMQQVVPWAGRPPQARPAAPRPDRVDEPIEDAGDLDDAIEAARLDASDEPDDQLVDAPVPSAVGAAPPD